MSIWSDSLPETKTKAPASGPNYDRPHVFVATPAYDGKVDTDYSQSLAEAAIASTVYGIRMTASVMGNGAFIDLARCMFAKFFLKEPDATHLFFIDSDLKFEPRAFVSLIQSCTEDRPVVCGVYPRRQKTEDYPIRWTPHPELSKDGIDRLWFDDEGWLMVNRVPTGFLCIRRNIIEEMAKKAVKMDIKGQGVVPRLFYTKETEAEGSVSGLVRFVGEDFCWSDDYVEQYGKNIHCWPDFDFVHGGIEGNYQKWLKEHTSAVADDGTPQKWKDVEEKRARIGDRKDE